MPEADSGLETGDGAPAENLDTDPDLADRVVISPAAAREADKSVQRATRGLMRLDSRRRLRWVARRIFLAFLILAAIGMLGYLISEDVAHWFNIYWDQMKAKIELSREGSL